MFGFLAFDGSIGRGESLFERRETLAWMPSQTKPSKVNLGWSPEAHAIAQQARVVSGHKLEELVVRLQRHSGRTKDKCWRFIIQQGLKRSIDYRPWTDQEKDDAREELVKKSVSEVAQKLHRSPEAVRGMLRRNHLRIREIRCDLFSIESLSAALKIRKSEIHYWIDQGWLQATVHTHGHKNSYIITPEALTQLYKGHLSKLLARGAPNLSLFEAYLQYCYSPKHTVGTQLLDVRRDKRERAAYAAHNGDDATDEGEENDEDESRYQLDIQPADSFSDGGGSYNE